MPRGEFDRSGRRARTRARLLDAAARVYARRGFDAATIDEVAAEAGLTKGAVYDHFGSKENLLFALLDEHLSTQISEQIALFDPAKDPVERPRAGADRWMRELREDPDAFRLFVEAWVRAQREPGMRDRVATGINAWRGMFTAFGAQQEGEVPEELVDAVANVMLGLGTGIAMIKLIDPEGVPDRLLGAAFALLLRSLESSEEAREILREAVAQRAGSASD
jgi:AcrR family transcriptional regulator